MSNKPYTVVTYKWNFDRLNTEHHDLFSYDSALEFLSVFDYDTAKIYDSETNELVYISSVSETETYA